MLVSTDTAADKTQQKLKRDNIIELILHPDSEGDISIDNFNSAVYDN